MDQNISNNDGQGLQEFADRSRRLYETLRSLNALSEMNMSNAVAGPKTTKMAEQVGPSDRAKSDKESNSTTQKVKCYGCEATHKIEHCPDFINKSMRQRIVFARYKGLCSNCLRKGHFF